MSGGIPTSLTNLTLLTSLVLSCGLTSTDPTVIAFLDTKSPGWQDDQCLQDPILFASDLSGPFGLEFDQSGDLFVANENGGGTPSYISKIEPDGSTSTFAENFTGAAGLAINNSGVLHVSDDTNQVFQIDGSGNVTIFIPSATGLSNPNAIAFDASDHLYVLSAGGFVSKFDPAGNLVNLNLATGLIPSRDCCGQRYRIALYI